MRLLTYVDGGRERLGVLVGAGTNAGVADAGALLGEPDLRMETLVARGDAGLRPLRSRLEADGRDAPASVPLDAVELRAPLPRPGKIVAVGRNYREHAAEEGASVASEPVLFTKYSSSVIGPGDLIRWRAEDSSEVDYEAELAVIIGRRTRDVAAEAALDSVFGYTCLNDVSARDLQVRDGQWVRAKSLDTFCPMGPWIVTRDELPDPGALAIRCRVNGELRQDATTGELVHGVASLIAFCSRFFTLEPGDVIATGTPGGVGAFRVPPVFLANGDVVEVEIDGIGRLVNRCQVQEE